MVNYSKWDNIDSDENSDGETDTKLISSGNYADKIKLARLRKLDADAVLDTINNRKIDAEVAKGFQDARALYIGSLSALGDSGLEKTPSNKSLWIEARELRLSCHLNIVAGAMQGRQFDIALEHVEQALSIQPDHPKANEFYGYVLLKLNRPKESVTIYSKTLKLLREADPNGDYSELLGFLEQAQQMASEMSEKSSNSPKSNTSSSLMSIDKHTAVRSTNQVSVKEARDELNRLMSQAQACMMKHDYQSAERFYQDAKRLCLKPQCEDHQGLGIVSLQLSQIFILQADAASVEKQVVKYEKKLMQAMTEIADGNKSIANVMKEAFDNIGEWNKEHVEQDKRVEFLSRMCLIKARLLHREFSVYQRKSTNGACNRGFASDRNQARIKSVVCLQHAVDVLDQALQPWMISIKDMEQTSSLDLAMILEGILQIDEKEDVLPATISASNGDEVFEIDRDGNMVPEHIAGSKNSRKSRKNLTPAQLKLRASFGDKKLSAAPPGWRLLYIQLCMELGRMLLRLRSKDTDLEEGEDAEGDHDLKDSYVKAAQRVVEKGHELLFSPQSSMSTQLEAIQNETKLRLDIDMLELLSEVCASNGDFKKARTYSLQVYDLLLQSLKSLHNSNKGTQPSKEYVNLCDDDVEDGDVLKLTPAMKTCLNKVKYGSTEQGRLELRIAALEISLGHIHHQLSQQKILTSFQSKMNEYEETGKHFISASKRLSKCGQPLKAAQVRKDIQRLYMFEHELKMLRLGAKEENDAFVNSSKRVVEGPKESESEQQVRYSNMAEHLIEAAKLFTEAKYLCQIMNNYKNKSVPLMSGEPFSSKFHRRVSMLINWEVDCLDRCVSLWQHSCVDLCEVHAMLHVALSSVYKESQDVAHLKQIADNKHQWALAATKAARNTTELSSSGGGGGGSGYDEKHHGADLAERLLSEAEKEYVKLDDFEEAAGVCIARAILIKQRSRLVEALSLVEQALSHWNKFEKLRAQKPTLDASTLGPTPSTRKLDEYSSKKESKSSRDSASGLELLHRAKLTSSEAQGNYDKTACQLLLEQWGKEHHAASSASTTTAVSSKFEAPLCDDESPSATLDKNTLRNRKGKTANNLNQVTKATATVPTTHHSLDSSQNAERLTPSFMSYVARLFNALLHGENGFAWTLGLALVLAFCFTIISKFALLVISSPQSIKDTHES